MILEHKKAELWQLQTQWDFPVATHGLAIMESLPLNQLH
jgi:hypothetical protein